MKIKDIIKLIEVESINGITEEKLCKLAKIFKEYGEVEAAYVLYTVAAERNSGEAHYQLGLMYEGRELFGNADFVQARKHFEAAFENEHIEGTSKLGSYMYSGFGGAKDETSAIELYYIAAEEGCMKARRELYCLMREGIIPYDADIDNSLDLKHLIEAISRFSC